MIPPKTIQGLRVRTPKPFTDHRGQYVELFRADDEGLFDSQGRPIHFVEDDISFSHRGVLRGLHGDDRTWKLVRCVRGEVYLAVADLRPESRSYRTWIGLRLSAENHVQVLIPPGCVNGHLALRDCGFLYKQSEYYRGAEAQMSVRWNDPAFRIPWPLHELDGPPILSERDADAPLLALEKG